MLFFSASREHASAVGVLDQICPESLVRSDKRRHARIPFRHLYNTVVLNAPGRPLATVITRNLSANGLGFISPREFSPGEQFVLSCVVRGTIKTILCRVCYCRPEGPHYFFAGAQFIQVSTSTDKFSPLPADWVEFPLGPVGRAGR